MTQQEILNSGNSKTKKIILLLGLGLTRREVATLMQVGYGFVQNVYATQHPELIRHRQAAEVVRWTESAFVFNQTFGVEIEAFGVERETLKQALISEGVAVGFADWKIKKDSSIRGDNTFEISSPKLQGQDGLNELAKVCRVLAQHRARINKTCGLHIHIDATEFILADWKRLYKNYARLEPVIDSFMPQSRRGDSNTYCKSVRFADFETKIDSLGNIRAIASGLKKLQRATCGSSRYFKLNSQSYWEHRSVEFRQHSGTIEFTKISNWIQFLARFVEISKAKTIDGTRESLSEFLPNELIAYFNERTEELAQ